MIRLAAAILIIVCGPALADSVTVVRTIPSKTILSAADLRVIESDVPGYFQKIEELVGLETRVVLYAGRTIAASAVGPAALIERNQLVTIIFRRGGLEITAEGRALARAGKGEAIRAMNLASRTIVNGRVRADGAIQVGLED